MAKKEEITPPTEAQIIVAATNAAMAVLESEKKQEKSLGCTDFNTTKSNVPDVVTFGDSDGWKLICKASSESQGWMKSTKAMDVNGTSVIVQTETQQRNPDGSYALSQAVVFVQRCQIHEELDGDNKLVSRKLIYN